MPKPGYTQSPEHKKKRLEQIEGDGNGSYKDGRRSYRRKAGAKNNDGTVVHHKNGDRTNNCASNLERLTDGDRTPGRRTTSAHEKHHGGRHGDSIALLHHDRKTGGCGRGKVGDGRGNCRPAKGEGIDAAHKRVADFLSDRFGVGKTNKSIRKAVRKGFPIGLAATGIVAGGITLKSAHDMTKSKTAKDPSYGTNADSILPTAIALLHHDRKTGGCGKGKVGTGDGDCKPAKGKARQATGLSRLVAKPPDYTKKPAFSHRTAKESGAAKAENIVWPLAIGAGAVGLAGLAGTGIYFAMKGNGSGEKGSPVPPTSKPPLSVTTPVKERSQTLRSPVSPEKKKKKELLKGLLSAKASSPSASPAIAPEVKPVKSLPASPPLTKEEKKERSQVIKSLLRLPAAGESTDMSNSPYSPLRLRPEDEVTVGKKGGRKKKKETAEDIATKEFESKPGHYHFVKISGVRFKKKVDPAFTRTIDEIPGKLSTSNRSVRRILSWTRDQKPKKS